MKRLRAAALALMTSACAPLPIAGLTGGACAGAAWWTIPKEISDDALLVGGNIERVICGVERLKLHTPEVLAQIDGFCDDLPDDLLSLAGKGVELWRLIRAEHT